MNKVVRMYLSRIGESGGKKSRRILTREESLRMTAIRESKKKNRCIK